jgi:hypothetical protein
MIAKRDKGQPDDIKKRIKSLVGKYLADPFSIIIAVMQSRVDLETDLGLHFIKKYDTNLERTIGVLTKPDLMNHQEHIGNYLIGDVSNDLKFSYGYYTIKNKTTNDEKYFQKELNFFQSHPEYKKPKYKSKIGIKNLIAQLNNILITAIKKELPEVLDKINNIYQFNKNKLFQIEQNTISITASATEKITYVNNYLTGISKIIRESIDSIGSKFNTGKQLKDTFKAMKKESIELNPFDKFIYTPQYYNNIIAGFEGNRMTSYVPIIEIMEICLTDTDYRPIMKLEQIYKKCFQKIIDILLKTVSFAVNSEKYNKYPVLSKLIYTILHQLLLDQKQLTQKEVYNLLLSEESYIWTDNDIFYETIDKVKSQDNLKQLDLLLKTYYKIIKINLNHMVPKIIMKNMVNNLKVSGLSVLMNAIAEKDISILLSRDSKIENEIKHCIEMLQKIDVIKNMVKDESL